MSTRRKFIKNIALATTSLLAAPYISIANKKTAGGYENVDRLKLGIVGSGLMGSENMRRFISKGQTFAAVCDVDKAYGIPKGKSLAEKNAPVFTDYREMFSQMEGKLDGIIIATPDHSHFAAAMCAIKHGFNVYLEKPMCHTLGQIRALRDFARTKNVVTQMGNQVHSGNGIRIAKEWIAAGVIGNVREVVMWTCRPFKGCNRPSMGYKQWPSEKVPETLDWDKWLNVAEYGPYSSEVVPLNWRRVYKYGSGSLGDIGAHIIDVPYTALGLDMPSLITSRQRGGTEISVPLQDEVIYNFDTSNQGQKVKLKWYSGFVKPDKNGTWDSYKNYDLSFLPKLPKEYTDTGRSYKDLSTEDGMFIIGDEGVLYSPTMHLFGKPVVLPKKRTKFAMSVPESEPRIRYNDHHINFIDAIAGKVKKAASDFDTAAKLTEIVQLGNLTLRANENIVWDSKNMVCKGGSAKINSFINPPMRKGWY